MRQNASFSRDAPPSKLLKVLFSQQVQNLTIDTQFTNFKDIFPNPSLGQNPNIL